MSLGLKKLVDFTGSYRLTLFLKTMHPVLINLFNGSFIMYIKLK